MKTLQVIGDDSCFRILADAVTDCAICMLYPDGIVCSWNAGAQRILGYLPGEIIGRHFACLFTEEDQRTEIPNERLRTADRTGRFEDEIWQVRKNGARFRALVVVDAIRDHDGRMIGFAKLTRDLTERQRTDETLRRSEERFRRVVEATPNAMVMVDRDGRIAMVNAQTERVFGYTRTELLGQPMEMLTPERFRGHHPELRTAFFDDPGTRPMGAGRDLYGLRKDGSEFSVEIGLNPIETDDGTMVLSAIMDISDRKREESRIRASLKEKDILLGEIHHRVKNNLQIVDSLLGLQSGGIQDTGIQDILRESQNRIKSMALIHQILYQSKDFARMDFSNFLDTLVPTLASSYGADPDRIVLAIPCDRSAAAAQRGDPLRPDGERTRLKRTQARVSGKPARRNPHRARTAVERAARLIKQLLMFARRQIMRPVTVDLNRLIAEFDKLFVQAPGKEIRLVTRLNPDLSPSRLDPAQFESAILNLVMNARDAISGNGRIVVETQNVDLGPDFAVENPDMAPGRYVMVTVSDTGAGISDEIMPRVFDPFFTTKGVGEGAGLGLSQVYGFTKESGGHVRIDSALGVGTTVRLYLPCADDAPVAAEQGSNPTQARKTSGALTVLVVEDDEMVLTLAGDILREFGYRLLTAGDAAAALVILNGDEPIDILISDVSMPGAMNGVQLAVEARRLRPSIKVLLTSGYPATVLASQHGLESNMPLLGKPYRPQQLADSFRIILDED